MRTISEEQWAAAQQLFYEQIDGMEGRAKSMDDEKYELIVSILDTWDEMSNSERRERSGNAHFWRNKYVVSRASPESNGELLEASSNKLVVKHGDLFEIIKTIHLHSTCVHVHVHVHRAVCDCVHVESADVLLFGR